MNNIRCIIGAEAIYLLMAMLQLRKGEAFQYWARMITIIRFQRDFEMVILSLKFEVKTIFFSLFLTILTKNT